MAGERQENTDHPTIKVSVEEIRWVLIESESIDDKVEPQPDPSGLGIRQEVPTGPTTYAAKLRGIGIISGDDDYGSFLSDTTYSDSREIAPSARVILDMAKLFPWDWKEKKVEYEIFVKARLVEPPLENQD